MRCLGLSNSPMVMPNGSRQQVPSSETTKSQSPPLAHSPPITSLASQNSPNTPNAHITTRTTSSIDANDNRFTLMHPAFQSPHQTDKSLASDKLTSITKTGSINLSPMPIAPHPNGTLTYSADFSLKTSYAKHFSNGTHYLDRIGHHNDRIRDVGSGDESDSEEIDLTSNGCIDFSNNNNSKCQ